MTNKIHTVRKGDTLYDIAKNNGMSLSELIRLNPTKKNVIYVDDTLRLKPDTITETVNLRDERTKEDRLNLENVTAIQGYRHDSNYAIIDKKNRTISIYDKNNNLLSTVNGISTGLSGNDYNTVTYSSKTGSLANYAGNNSTPAGITRITSKNEYHGYPSFTRGRVNNEDKVSLVNAWKKDNNGKWYKSDELTDDNVASSIHIGDTSNAKNTNGCIRVNPKGLQELGKYLEVGDNIYTLPEQEGSRFTLRGGRLHFTADNPYGVVKPGKLSESGHDMINWDDYNIKVDKTYSPLKFKWTKTGNEEYDKNRHDFAQSITDNKKVLQEKFGLTSDEYNHLAELALGIAEQETKFGTSDSYKLKQHITEGGVSLLKGLQKQIKPKYGRDLTKGWSLAGIAGFLTNPLASIMSSAVVGDRMAQSRGYTQIKNTSDNKDLQNIYKQLRIDNSSIKRADKSAVATIARLAYMYNNEVKGRLFKNNNNETINPYNSLMYKWLGKTKELTNKTATPNKNKYIRNVRDYSKRFDMYETRTYNKYRNGGRLSIEDVY